VVAMDDAHVELIECHVRDNKGPGIDASDRATVSAVRCWIKVIRHTLLLLGF
jgi:hypothetical protein